jgi:SAM-dependent MidA family methyltransferase
MSNNLDLIKVIVDRIGNSSQQRITFANYMELVLYHSEHGYYASSAERISVGGDFLTSPHLADDFGEMLAIQLHQMWEILDSPQIFTIVEMGAGQGLLAAQILDYSRRIYPDFFGCIDYLIIETAPAMIIAQQQKLKDLPVEWGDWTKIVDRSIVGCFLSNELIDAFPVHQVITIDRALQEIYVIHS